MRILVHDYAGYPFTMQLSRSLAKRGHQVIHAYCGSLETTPQGALADVESDAGCLEVRRIELDEPVSKYAFLTRRRQEIEYGRRLVALVDGLEVDAVISADTPLDAQVQLVRKCKEKNLQLIYWVQDLLGIGAERILGKKLPVVGEMVGRYYIGLEIRLLQQSDEVVLITEGFRPVMEAWKVDPRKVHVVPNWGPLDELPMQPKDNEWARQHGLADKFCFLYAGTLGLKHNPELLVQLANKFRELESVRVVVVSQGLGAEHVKARKQELQLDNLLVMGFQPYRDMPQALGAGDVLVGLLEPEAGVCSVPSKVLSYLCAGQPLLLAVPGENQAARIVADNCAGLVVSPRDTEGFLVAAEHLMQDERSRTEFGRNARQYAEEHFDIEKITDQFEHIVSARQQNIRNTIGSKGLAEARRA